MFEKVLFPVTTTEITEQLLDFIPNFSFTDTKEVSMLHIVDSTDLYGDPIIINADKDLLLKWKARLLSYNFSQIRARVEVGIPWEEIVDIAERDNYSIIFMGSHGSRLLKRVFLGSVTENVLHHSKKPVMIFKFGYTINLDDNGQAEAVPGSELFRKILYATDFSDNSERCIPYMDKINPDSNDELIMLHIQDLRTLKFASQEKISQFNRIDYDRFDRLKDHFQGLGFKNIKTLIKTGYSISDILDTIDQHRPSLVIMGAKGKSNIREMILGGVTEIIVHKSKSPVFIVR